jgi:RNA-directed DNA polymerase
MVEIEAAPSSGRPLSWCAGHGALLTECESPAGRGERNRWPKATATYEVARSVAVKPDGSNPTVHLMEQVVDRDNLNRAYFRVVSNKGSAGADGMTVDELLDWCRTNGQALSESLLSGTHRSLPVKGVRVPKPAGGARQLGIPTVVDRLVQQALLQVLDPVLDPTFSESSYGFRPGRGAHDALATGSRHVSEGYVYVVDLDLEEFLDRVNHDIVLARLARYLKDKRLLKIVRTFLKAGLMHEGVVHDRCEGMPHGGPCRVQVQAFWRECH